MSDDLTIRFSQQDIALYNAQTQRMVTELHKTPEYAVKYASVALTRSLGASTKVAPKLRPIVKNPLFKIAKGASKEERAKAMQSRGDARRAAVGVEKYDRSGNAYFVPIYRTGQFGKTRFEKDGSITIFSDDKTRRNYSADEFQAMQLEMPSVKNSKKRKIGRRGLAKASWGWINGKLGKFTKTLQAEIPGTVAVKTVPMFNDYMVVIDNKLRYIVSALRGGRKDVNTAMLRAAEGMRGNVDRKLKAAMP